MIVRRYMTDPSLAATKVLRATKIVSFRLLANLRG
jgi:hypothetical protein